MPSKKQIGAIPVRRASDGGLEVLLVTSRETRRWIIPKGWPIDHLSDAEAAAVEAWEEAGVQGTACARAIGSFCYDKRRPKEIVPIVVDVYRLDVTTIADDWPEAAQRRRAWYRPRDAASLVQEPELQVLIAGLE